MIDIDKDTDDGYGTKETRKSRLISRFRSTTRHFAIFPVPTRVKKAINDRGNITLTRENKTRLRHTLIFTSSGINTGVDLC